MDKTQAIETVLKFLKSLSEDGPDEQALDEVVHETAATLASDANNGGPRSQIEFLLDNGWNADSIIGYLKAEY